MLLLQDLKFSFRTLRKTPSVTLLALCALALGIGANAALFTVVNTILLRPLNYPAANRLFELHRQYPSGHGLGNLRPQVSVLGEGESRLRQYGCQRRSQLGTEPDQ
jgi:hypothetical protein